MMAQRNGILQHCGYPEGQHQNAKDGNMDKGNGNAKELAAIDALSESVGVMSEIIKESAEQLNHAEAIITAYETQIEDLKHRLYGDKYAAPRPSKLAEKLAEDVVRIANERDELSAQLDARSKYIVQLEARLNEAQLQRNEARDELTKAIGRETLLSEELKANATRDSALPEAS